MRIFRKNSNRELPHFIINFLTIINNKLLKFAKYLEQKTKHYSDSKKKLFLFLFCLVFVAESSIVIILSLQKVPAFSYSVEPIKFIQPPEISGDGFGLSASAYKRIKRFSHYLDSNTVFRDSILSTRPHLIDTLNFLKQMYKQDENGK